MPDLSPEPRSAAAADADTRAVRVRVTGQVQGVFFRASTRDTARACGVGGWVRNEPDGSVTAVLEGTPGAVDAVLDWVRGGGPPRARVDQVHVEPVGPEGHGGFAIRR